MLDRFFTNKIPSTEPDWTDELIRVASIFNEFDGLEYDYVELTERFSAISRRVPDARDSSDYRDEYSAYASYLGIVHFRKNSALPIWRYEMNKRAQDLLCSIMPDPEAYLRLQLALLQYPNPIGSIIQPNGNLRIEPQSLRKRVDLVKKGVHTSPFRLFLRVLIALGEKAGRDEAYLTAPEIWNCLFTRAKAVGTFDPPGNELADDILIFRRARTAGRGSIPTEPFRNLHILGHTGLILYHNARGRLPKRIVLESDVIDPTSELGKIARELANLTNKINPPPAKAKKEEVKKWTRDLLESGEWADYYSGNTVKFDSVRVISQSVISVDDTMLTGKPGGAGAPLHDLIKERAERKKKLSSRRANPQETQVLREKANFQHRAIVGLLADRLNALGVKPLSNVFIDLAAHMPVKKMLFEVKSCVHSNMLSQVRKGISQLYEYCYRHDELKGAKPVLVLETRPDKELEWLIDYLIKDRGIALCWLEGEDTFAAPGVCADCLGPIVHRLEA